MTETPIVLKESYTTLIQLCKLVSKLPKSSKYSLWEKIKEYSFDTVAEISLTTKSFWFEEKIEHLKQAKKDIELTLIALRLCNDIWDISHNEYEKNTVKIKEISSQLIKRETFCNNKLKEQNNLLK